MLEGVKRQRYVKVMFVMEVFKLCISGFSCALNAILHSRRCEGFDMRKPGAVPHIEIDMNPINPDMDVSKIVVATPSEIEMDININPDGRVLPLRHETEFPKAD
ncbi:hypothetical protein K440DRAFT_640614 [Wilcoxina mikolae CBS 423.85]|nr:hypothetical protein K440DRAFT_640614 [Wilcoxina mikolae CBS 423.85]